MAVPSFRLASSRYVVAVIFFSFLFRFIFDPFCLYSSVFLGNFLRDAYIYTPEWLASARNRLLEIVCFDESPKKS